MIRNRLLANQYKLRLEATFFWKWGDWALTHSIWCGRHRQLFKCGLFHSNRRGALHSFVHEDLTEVWVLKFTLTSSLPFAQSVGRLSMTRTRRVCDSFENVYWCQSIFKYRQLIVRQINKLTLAEGIFTAFATELKKLVATFDASWATLFPLERESERAVVELELLNEIGSFIALIKPLCLP